MSRPGRAAQRPAGGARRRAREVAFRVVYEADITRDACDAVWQRLREEADLASDPAELVEDVVRTMDARAVEIDALLGNAAEKWTVERLSATDRSVLRAAAAELLGRAGTPARVVIDEAVSIAKRYGSVESGRFVNGVLDRLARELRPDEF